MPWGKPSFPLLKGDHPLAQGLIGAWPAFEGSGPTTKDQSGRGRTATLQSGASWAAGQFGWCIQLANSSTGYVDAGTSIPVTAVTLACWIKPTSFPNAYNSTLVASGSDIQELFVKSTGQLAWYVFTGAGFQDYDGTGNFTLSANTWYHLAATYDAVNGGVGYVNGKVDGTFAANGVLTTAGGTLFHWGDDSQNAGRNFAGLIDSPLFYNRALSAIEVERLYQDHWAMYRSRATPVKSAAAAFVPKRPLFVGQSIPNAVSF